MRYIAALALIPLTFLVTSCSDSTEDINQDQADEYFTGSPDEYWQLMITCYDEHGVEAEQDRNSLGVSSTLDSDDFLPIQEECLSRIPPFPPTDQVPDEQLELMYAWRAEQYECMVDHGYLTGQPISFEEFKSRRIEDQSNWSVLDELDTDDLLAASNACPEATNAW